MLFTKLNNKGASLVELVAAMSLTSICLILLINMLTVNVKQNGINQNISVNANVANAALSYIQSRDFISLKEYLVENNNGTYAIINVNSCNLIFNNDIDVCESVLAPTINNKQFNDSNLNVFLLPYNDPLILESLKMTPPITFPEILNEYLSKIDTSNYNAGNVNSNIIRVIVVVESNFEHANIIIEGVATNE